MVYSYLSDELDSVSEHFGLESDGDPKPRYPQLRKNELCQSFKFKLGMEFSSLQEFKYAILEHFVLNGKQVKFVKNDAVRVRVKCS